MKKPTPSFKEKVIRAVADGLYRRVGRGRELDFATFADAIGDEKDRNSRGYATGECEMPLHKFLLAAETLGPGFLDEVLVLIGMQGASRADVTDGNPHAVNVELASSIQLISAALRDGTISARERPAIIVALNDLMEQVNAYLAALKDQQQQQ